LGVEGGNDGEVLDDCSIQSLVHNRDFIFTLFFFLVVTPPLPFKLHAPRTLHHNSECSAYTNHLDAEDCARQTASEASDRGSKATILVVDSPADPLTEKS
jgi:hypothetical protein